MLPFPGKSLKKAATASAAAIVPFPPPFLADPELAGDVPDPAAYHRAMARLEQSPVKAPELPARYADPATSKLEVTVTEGGTTPHDVTFTAPPA